MAKTVESITKLLKKAATKTGQFARQFVNSRYSPASWGNLTGILFASTVHTAVTMIDAAENGDNEDIASTTSAFAGLAAATVVSTGVTLWSVRENRLREKKALIEAKEAGRQEGLEEAKNKTPDDVETGRLEYEEHHSEEESNDEESPRLEDNDQESKNSQNEAEDANSEVAASSSNAKNNVENRDHADSDSSTSTNSSTFTATEDQAHEEDTVTECTSAQPTPRSPDSEAPRDPKILTQFHSKKSENKSSSEGSSGKEPSTSGRENTSVAAQTKSPRVKTG